MKILYCKNIWWPFGSHLTHTMYRKIYADMHDCKFLYTTNQHPAYSLYEGNIGKYYPNLSDEFDENLTKYIEEKYPNAGHRNPYVLEFDEEKNLVNEIELDFYKDILNGIPWDTFFTEKYSNPEYYRSSIIKKMAEPSNDIKNYLKKLPFIQEVENLNGDYIGMHIRWTDKTHGWCTEADFYDVDVYFNYAVELRKESSTNNIVINCDNTEALEKLVDFNDKNKLEFNIAYDKQEILPPNDWKECIFQKWCMGKVSDKNEFVKDLLNGFKIYKTLFEAKYIIGNLFSNMYLIPYIARNCNKDVNISQKPPYALCKNQKTMFSESVIQKRKDGKEELQILKNAKTIS